MGESKIHLTDKKLLPRTRYILNVLYVTGCLSRYFHWRYRWKYIDIRKSLNGASERKLFTSNWHSLNNSRLLELISFLTLSTIFGGRMSIYLLAVPGAEVVLVRKSDLTVTEVSVMAALSVSGTGSPEMWTVFSRSSVFPFAKDISLLSLCVSDRSERCKFSFKIFNLIEKQNKENDKYPVLTILWKVFMAVRAVYASWHRANRAI